MERTTLMDSRTLKRMTVATLGVAVLVFGVTFLGQYLRTGQSGPNPGTPPPAAAPQDLLVFEHKKWGMPPETTEGTVPAAPVIEEEYDWSKPGEHEYPFQANSNDPVEVGLLQKACTCSKVEIAWGPKDAPRESLKWTELEQGDPRQNREPNTVMVPAHANGFVRMHWKAEVTAKSVETKSYYAKLVSRSGEAYGKMVELDAKVVYLYPIVFQTVDSVQNPNSKSEGNLTVLGVLQEGQEVPIEFYCWSATHDHFDLEPLKDRLVRLGEVRELWGKDRDDLARKLQRHVKCAYRVTAFYKGVDLGPFRYAVNVPFRTSPPDAERAEVSVVFEGAIRGQIAARDEQGRETGSIDLGNFPSSRGVEEKQVRLEAVQPDLDLKVIKRPEDDFLQVTDVMPLPSGSGRRAWNLGITILPNKVFGPFGGPGAARECIILLDVTRNGQKVQQLRLPVTGNATSQ